MVYSDGDKISRRRFFLDRPGRSVPGPVEAQRYRPSDGTVYGDVMAHCQKPFTGDSRSTNAHETAHAIASSLRTQQGWNGFYLGSGRGYVLPEPAMRLQDVQVPMRHRGWRHDTYLVDQRRWWNDQPLYIIDEWVAYITGGSVALDDHNAGRGTERSDCVSGCHEFMIYSDYLRQQLPADYQAREAFDSLFWSLLDRTLKLHEAGREIFKSEKSDRLAAVYTPPKRKEPELRPWRIEL